MAIIKCKMCGGDLNLVEGASTAECEFCGVVQTIPVLDDEKKLFQFERAERLRKQCEFDKAAAIYETIVADFRQEAEAYWGLVLCKYGIEYVDDPGSGKKIPTCHRSSFDSIMDDSDFEQTLENADGTARKVYREEAKTIEEIRKGIIAVSANEEPYDIFICYKETAENGDRTLDSVLAQDIYDALTDKGYRVFFARITLEDKLGQEYEPYIFAALNSAKIMLVFGTDYEYFNAVWVKNEWSRFLKLMTKNKERHLIPCYKGIDAYDMPKEFAKLQAQDLGKVGAIQDLLRGIEKILPRQTETKTVAQERVVIGGSGDNKIASLLDRGNMALEDGDWAKADSFFEDVLNNDSKNAQAYLGKTLAMEKCRTLDALVRKQKDSCQHANSYQFFLEADKERVEAAAQQYSIKGYVNQDEIRRLYNFDLSYSSSVESRRQQRLEIESWWENHKWLSRAEKFASGEFAKILKQAYNDLLSALDARIGQAERSELDAHNKRKKQYAEHLDQADNSAKELYEKGAASREKDYTDACRVIEKTVDIPKLKLATEMLRKLSGYKDSAAKYAEGMRKIKEITDSQQAAQKAEEAKKRAEEFERERQKARIKKLKTVRNVIILAVIAIFLVLLFTRILPGKKYNSAVQLYEAGNFSEALDMFIKVHNYEDSVDRAFACAEALDVAGDKLSAFNGYRKLLPYRDCQEIIYTYAEEYIAAGDNAHAAMCYGALGDYKDSRTVSFALWNDIAKRDTISACGYATVGLMSDGTVVATGKDIGKSDLDIVTEVAEWTDIIAISAGDEHAVGLKADGTVVAVGSNSHGQCKVSKWTDIVAICTGDASTIGLRADGTVVATGNNNHGACEVSEWTDIVAISAGIIHTVGLKSDGTVVAVGDNVRGQCEVSEWTDMVAISAGERYTMGLKSDGSVALLGTSEYFNPDLSSMTNIVAISVSAGFIVAQRSDGTMIGIGDNEYGECDVSEWTDIVAFATGSHHTVGIQADGDVEFTGMSKFGQGQCTRWTGIKIPD